MEVRAEHWACGRKRRAPNGTAPLCLTWRTPSRREKLKVCLHMDFKVRGGRLEPSSSAKLKNKTKQKQAFTIFINVLEVIYLNSYLLFSFPLGDNAPFDILLHFRLFWVKKPAKKKKKRWLLCEYKILIWSPDRHTIHTESLKCSESLTY